MAHHHSAIGNKTQIRLFDRSLRSVGWSGTFHAVGARLLRHHAHAIGLDPSFTADHLKSVPSVHMRCRITAGLRATATLALIPTNQCAKNCSFVSGEAASIFMALYAIGLLIPQWSAVALAAGTLCGLAAGMVRISRGAHFLSDVVFAAVFMALTAVLVHRAMFGRLRIRAKAPATIGARAV